MGDLKKKIMDILFEEEPEGTIASGSFEYPKNTKKVESTVKAKDILYKKDDGHSTFIEYLTEENKTEEVKPNKKVEEVYELRDNVSPIFGNINSKDNKVVVEKKAEEIKPETNPKYYSFADFSGVVISPIFGYDNIKANEARKSMDYNGLELEKEKTNEVVEDFIPEEIKEEYVEDKVEDFEEEFIQEDEPKEESILVETSNEVQEEINFENIEDETSNEDSLLEGTYDFGDLSDDDKDLFDELIGEDD